MILLLLMLLQTSPPEGAVKKPAAPVTEIKPQIPSGDPYAGKTVQKCFSMLSGCSFPYYVCNAFNSRKQQISGPKFDAILIVQRTGLPVEAFRPQNVYADLSSVGK